MGHFLQAISPAGVAYFDFVVGFETSSPVHVWPPFQLINSRPQVQLNESMSRMSVLIFRIFQAQPHSQVTTSPFIMCRSILPPLVGEQAKPFKSHSQSTRFVTPPDYYKNYTAFILSVLPLCVF
jgi:hypothetical protein